LSEDLNSSWNNPEWDRRWYPAEMALDYVLEAHEEIRKQNELGCGMYVGTSDFEILVCVPSHDFDGPSSHVTSAYYEADEKHGGPGWVVYGKAPDPDLKIAAWMPMPWPPSPYVHVPSTHIARPSEKAAQSRH